MMLVVSFYTPDYEPHAKRLVASCESVGYRHRVDPLPDTGVWVRNCAHKGPFLHQVLSQADGPILWVDADGEILRRLEAIEALDADVALVDTKEREPRIRYRTGTLWLNQTPGAAGFVAEFADRCASEPDLWDQEHIYRTIADTPAKVAYLPMSYCQRFDEPSGVRDPHIIHHQASREMRRKKP
jgi:hypothetical protein